MEEDKVGMRKTVEKRERGLEGMTELGKGEEKQEEDNAEMGITVDGKEEGKNET